MTVFYTKNSMSNELSQLPPPPKGQTGVTLDSLKGLPPPPPGQKGMTLQEVGNSTKPRTGSAGQSIGTDHGSASANLWANLAATPAAFAGAGKAAFNLLTSSEQGVGGEIAAGLPSSITGEDTLNKANQNNANSDVAYIKSINDIKKSGKPLTKQQQEIYDHILQTNSSVGTQADLLPHATDSNIDAAINVGGVALDTLGAGTYGKAAKTGELLKATPTAVEAGKGAIETAQKVLTSTAEQQAAKETAKIVETVTPKLTAKETTEAVASRGAKKSGLLGKIELNVDPAAERIAQTVKEFVPGFNSSKSLVENINATKNAVGNLASDLKKQVIETGQDRIYSFKELGSTLKGLEKPTLLVGDTEKVYENVVNKALEIARNNGGKVSDLFQARKEFDEFVSKQFPNLYSSDTLTPLRLAIKNVRNGMTDFTAEHLPDIGLRNSLTNQSRLLDAIENMSEKASSGAAKEVGTNVLTRLAKKHPNVKNALVAGGAALGINKLVKETTGFGI